MKTLKATIAMALLLSTLAIPAGAKSVWDQIQETAPLQTPFETLRDSAP